MDVWTEIKTLVGKTLRTLDQNNAFDVIAVTDQAVGQRPLRWSLACPLQL